MITQLRQQECIIQHVTKIVPACAAMNGNTRIKDGMLTILSMLHVVRTATFQPFHTKLLTIIHIKTLTSFNYIE